jgi:hypothetical protein
MQMQEAGTIESQYELSTSMLGIGSVVMSFFCTTYSNIFGDSISVLEESNSKSLITKWRLDASTMDEIY